MSSTTPSRRSDHALAVMNLLNSGARYVLGQAIEAGGGTGGYMPAFTLLGGGDEVTRKMAFDWKASTTAYLNALDEWDKLDTKPRGVSKAEWVGQRATERSDAAVFSGVMTDDELVKLRRQAGATQYGDMSNEQLRLKIFNDQNGIPNPGTPEGAAGMARAAEATFTQPITDALGQGIQRTRQNPLVGWILPVFQTPYNGLKWMLERDIFIALPRQLMKEYRQARAGIKGMDTPFTAEEMAEARGKTLNAAAIAVATNYLWQTGVFTDGGSFNPDQRRRENSRIPPYSFSLGTLGVLQMSKLNLPGKSIDLVDLMGLQADIMRAHHENLIKDQDLKGLMTGVMQGYARALDNKQSLQGVMDLMNFIYRTATGQSADWAETMASQMNGILPLSGALTAGSRSFQDPNQMQASRRELSQTELDALGKDQNFAVFQDFAQKVARNYPLLGQAATKPSLVTGWAVSGAGCLACLTTWSPPLPQSSVATRRWTAGWRSMAWALCHGLAERVSGSDLQLPGAASTQMSNDEELSYRQAMWTIKGQPPAEQILGQKALINTGLGQYNINNYVQGRTLQEALTALSNDPEYNLDLESPNSPSIANTQLPYGEQSLANRKSRLTTLWGLQGLRRDHLLRPASAGVMAQAHPEFVDKALANWGVKQERIMEDLEAQP